MFDKQPKEINPSDTTELQDVLSPSQTPMEISEMKNKELFSKSESNQIETVNAVEKISGIISPYFIVLVGLFLYEDNFLIGTILIATGILALLKVSWKDVGGFFDKLKSLLGLK